MLPIAVVTDSSAGVDQAWAAEHDAWIIPLLLEIDGKILRDGIDITDERFFELLPTFSQLPNTLESPTSQVLQLFRALEKAGYEGILCVHLSSKVSNMCATARLAARGVSIPVEVVDTLATSSATLLCVETAVRAIARGARLTEAAEIVRRAAEEARTVFAVDTLDYIYQRGHLNAAEALVGSVLQFKPLLGFVGGEVRLLERVRTSARVIQRSVEMMLEWLGADTPVLARVVHGVSEEQAEQLRLLALEELRIVEMRTGHVPAIVGAHAGPSVYSLCCLPTKYAEL
ncbi:MAG: DegV family protein [Anaerolineales bacterium]